MNAPDFLFFTLRTTCLAGVAAAALGLAGCATSGLADTTMDSRSPVAAEAERLAQTNRPLPKFTDIPPLPTDVRPVPQYGVAARQIEAARVDLEQNTAPQTWSLDNTETFAAKARRETPEVAPANAADTEAFAKAAQKRATPPPPVKR